MNILILGGGGREHALAWKIAQSPLCDSLYIAPGNAGTATLGTNLSLSLGDVAGIRAALDQHAIELLVIGPEQPLVDGLVDALADHPVKVIGPSQAAAQLEGSKDFSKAFMQRHNIPTAAYRSFQQEELDEALAYIDQQPLPIVVKASGLAAGKGVLICEDHASARQGVQEMLSGTSFGAAGETVVIEEFLQGIEISLFVLADGTDYVLLPEAKDYKRIGEGDTGLNTGGMGAVSPVPFANEAFLNHARTHIIEPTLKGLAKENMPYRGFLFIGLMVVEGTPYVLEYNVRMGDPETEVVMPRISSDLVPVLQAAATGKLGEHSLQIDSRTCTTVMLVSGGYPKTYKKGKVMTGFEAAGEKIFFHAGTRLDGDQVLTNGGRVLAISAFGVDIEQAVGRSLQGAEAIQFEGKYYRRDIGKDLQNI